MTIGNPIVSNLLVSPIDRTAANPSISFGGSDYQNSGTGIYGSFGEINLALNGVDFLSFTEDGILYAGGEYDGVGSFQPLAPDLSLAAAAGSDDGTDPSFLAAVMGNLLGDAVVGEGNYLAGVIGAISVTNAASDYPTGALMGVVMDSVTNIDGCVVGVIDGDDPSGVTLPNAVFKVRQNNNNAASGANFGLDLYDAGNAHYTGGPVPFSIKQAEIRMSTQVCVLTGAGAPVDGTTGDDFAGTGSLYIDTTAGELYINTGSISASVWVLVGDQS